jgi:RnfABCDGE-type electron transport complex B subunit
MVSGTLAETLLDALPQTQCTRCGYADCRGYAEAIAGGEAEINRCPPGGAEGIARLARLSGRPVVPLDPTCGSEGRLLAHRRAGVHRLRALPEGMPESTRSSAAKHMHP